MDESKLDVLKSVPLFSHCSRKSLELVATRTDEVNAAAGRTLIEQGKAGDSFYVLLEGEADVLIDGKHRRTMRAGDFFGEISMLDRGLATATVITRTPARLMVMSHMQFRDAIKGNQELLMQVIAAIADRLRADSAERLATG